MAKLSAIVKNEKRKKLVAKFQGKRNALRAIIEDSSNPVEKIDEARRKLGELPRNSNPTRVRNRCMMSGRPRGVYRKFGLSRLALREMALSGHLPGVVKSSW